MKYLSMLLLMGFLISFPAISQNDINRQIHQKIKNGLEYSLQQKINSPADIIIVKTNHSNDYYLIIENNDQYVVTKEIIPPEINKTKDNLIEINKDSLSDVLWIKKKQFQNLLLSKSEFPFSKIRSRFQDNEFESLQNELKILEQTSYIETIKNKYDHLRIIQVESLDQAFRQLTKDLNNISATIKYPQQARENGTQGLVRIGYVLTKNASAVDIYIFQELKDGCTESVIDSIKEISQKMKEQGYSSEENIYIEGTMKFSLN